MKKPPQFKLKNIKRAQQIISGLPEKEDSCSREEAAEQLAEYFRRAFKKGYSPKEVAISLRKSGIIMPEILIARYQENNDEPENTTISAPPEKEECPKKNGEAQEKEEMPGGKSEKPVQENQSSTPEKITPPLDDLMAPVKKPPARHGGFEIRPDTPIGEL